MPERKIRYPKSLRDIPRWRQKELAENLLWFFRYTPSERLAYIDREWEETRKFIEKYELTKQ
jgi:hypothetical protein